jgi:hypothetical protein
LSNPNPSPNAKRVITLLKAYVLYSIAAATTTHTTPNLPKLVSGETREEHEAGRVRVV